MDTGIGIIILIVFLATIIMAAAFIIYWSVKSKGLNDKGYTQEEVDQKEEIDNRTEPLVEFFDAYVKDKNFDHYVSGIQTAKSILNFIVTFETTDGKIFNFHLNQDWFEQLQIGQKGVLMTINGNFGDFGNGEEIK